MSRAQFSFIPDETLKWIALCVLQDAEEDQDGFGTIFFERLDRYLRREKERELFGLPPQGYGNIKSGFAMISIIISLVLSLTLGLLGTISISSRTDLLHADVIRESAKFIGEKNYKVICPVSNNGKEISQFEGFETTGSLLDIPIDIKVSNEIISQYESYKESGIKQLNEEKIFLVLLSFSFPIRKFNESSNIQTESFRRNTTLAAERLLHQEELGGGRDDKPIMLVKDSRNVFFIVPALQNLFDITKNLAQDERIFTAALFSEIYYGDGNKRAASIWAELRKAEMSNTRRDSLGMLAEFTF